MQLTDSEGAKVGGSEIGGGWRVAFQMNSILVLKELEILWRVTGRRNPGPQAAALEAKFQMFRPTVLDMMREMVIIELQEDLPIVSLTREELLVLLGSKDDRVRLFGLRLAPHVKE